MVTAVVVRVVHNVGDVVISGTDRTGITHLPLAVDFHLVVTTRSFPRGSLLGGVLDAVAGAGTSAVKGV